MPTKIEIHPTARIAVKALVVAFVVVGVLVGAKRFFRSSPQAAETTTLSDVAESALISHEDMLIPVVSLAMEDASLEAGWSNALAKALSGHTEHRIEGGRVDVMTDDFAIEVDRLEKWHESIGQAAHYGLKTKKTPVAAIIISTDLWPLTTASKNKIRLIEETCLKQGIKLILLRRKDAGLLGNKP